MKQGVRIIAGKHRGRRIPVLDSEGLRPTPDRVRETLFNWLQNDIRGARCLDAFAGSGALGFEAMSRGATDVLMLEKNSRVYRHLYTWVRNLNEPALSLRQQDAVAFLKDSSLQFDVIFLDPPFALNLWEICLKHIESNTILAEGGLLYLESPQSLQLNETIWCCLKSKKSAQLVYALYQRRASDI